MESSGSVRHAAHGAALALGVGNAADVRAALESVRLRLVPPAEGA